MFKKIIFYIFFIIAFSFNTYVKAENNILFIDINYIFLKSIAGEKINNQIEIKIKEMNNELANYKKKIDDENKDLISKKNVLSQEELKNKSINLDKKIQEFKIIQSKKNNEINKYKNQLTNEFSKKLRKITQEYAEKNSIDMIFKKEFIVIGKNNLDVTMKVLDLFNKNVKTIKIN